MRILLADDDSKIHLIVRMWLNRNGHVVTSATNGREALDLLQKDYYDGLITDVNMPIMRGHELVQSVLKLPKPPRLIVMLTSRCDLNQLSEQINSPRVHYLSKPFSPAKLADLIEELRNKQESDNEQHQNHLAATD